ncbi:MAG: ABC transporter permease [ANME-2 cluster archaeon]|nr:ABC transporter permease [ANME-2 cluster archaeon]
MDLGHGPRKRILELASIASAVVIWEIIARIINIKYILPSFTSVVTAFIGLVQEGELYRDILASLNYFVLGMGLAIAVGIPIGTMMGWFKSIDRAVDPIIEMIRPIPPLAWIPFAILWFGLTKYAAGFVIFIGAVFPILINSYTGFKNTPRVLVESGKVLGCTRNRDIIFRIALPSALPSIATGIRVGMGVGWMCVVAAELFGVSRYGIGWKIWHWNDLHHMDMVLTYMLVLGLIALTIDRLFRYIVQEWWLKWQAGLVV